MEPNNNLTLIDVRHKHLNISSWYVTGTIYRVKDDAIGDTIDEFFDDIQSALDFMENELK